MLQSLKLSVPQWRARQASRLARLPLLARLCAAFALVYLFGAAVGVTGIVNLIDLRQRSDALYRQDMHGAISAERAQSALAMLSRAQLSVTMATSSSERDEAAADIDAALGRLDAALDGIRRAAPAQAERLQPERAQAGKLLLAYVALVRQQPLDPLQFDSAVSVDGHFVAEQLMKLSGMMEAARARQERQAAETMASVGSRQATAQALMIGLLAASLAAAAGLAWFAARSLTAELGGEPADAAGAATRIAAGDLTGDIRLRSGDAHSVLGQLSHMRDQLAGVLARIRDSAQDITTASAGIAAGNHDLAARTNQQAAALAGAADSVRRLAELVEQSHAQATESSSVARQAREAADSGSAVVRDMSGAMEAVHAHSRRIAEVVTLIESIAFQTNILALNAAVEAARAGPAGRGFAVVAQEVRALAQRSASSAREIGDIVGSATREIERGAHLSAGVVNAMDRIDSAVSHSHTLAGQLCGLADEQAQAVRAVGHSVGQLEQTAQQNAELVDTVAAQAERLDALAAGLEQDVARFRF
ncbi:hypothetical protein LMG23992_01848 [Cupriavidus laharis]|uniref:Methyl-accepting transducer domain-containing protein n=1 Tax=Cupriavidus laharis TaxID=151654 RepID=A0ABN7YBP3_9BURK|nr:methyl-accepting chemotaxis protein [Cupriavidus laharis]CAG9170833.1 hypothetical protein LMG23992_01848 [Cupriavidus laharis]